MLRTSITIPLPPRQTRLAKAGKTVKASKTVKADKSAKASSRKLHHARASEAPEPSARQRKIAQRAERRAAAATVRKVSRQPARVEALRVADSLDRDGGPKLASNAFMVQDLDSGKVLLQRNAQAVVPIASITKLMTAMVVLDAHLPLNEILTISDSDTDKLKSTSVAPDGRCEPAASGS